MSVFVDTSALYATLDRDDAHHAAAKQQWTEELSGSDPLITSNYILVETFALVQSHLGMDAVRTLTGDVLPILNIEWISTADHQAAVQAVLAANRRSLSFVDCTSFQVMRRLELQSAFAFDPHFAEQGFRVLPGGPVRDVDG